MTQWGLDVLFNPSKRHMDEEKQRLQSTREEVGDASGGKRIDLESGKVVIQRKPAPPAHQADTQADAEATDEPTTEPTNEAEGQATAATEAEPTNEAEAEAAEGETEAEPTNDAEAETEEPNEAEAEPRA